MADVFISYKRQERERIRSLATALETAGYTVWWDLELVAGETWKRRIKRELDAARCILVTWTKESVGQDGQYVSEWIEKESEEGLARRVLIPAMLDAGRIAWDQKHLQVADLTGWDGSPDSPALNGLIEGIARLAGPRERPSAVEAATWVTVETSPSVQRYEEFQALYPNSRFAEIAAQRALEIEEVAAWTALGPDPSVSDLTAFIRKWPGQRFADVASERILQKSRAIDTRTAGEAAVDPNADPPARTPWARIIAGSIMIAVVMLATWITFDSAAPGHHQAVPLVSAICVILIALTYLIHGALGFAFGFARPNLKGRIRRLLKDRANGVRISQAFFVQLEASKTKLSPGVSARRPEVLARSLSLALAPTRPHADPVADLPQLVQAMQDGKTRKRLLAALGSLPAERDVIIARISALFQGVERSAMNARRMASAAALVLLVVPILVATNISILHIAPRADDLPQLEAAFLASVPEAATPIALPADTAIETTTSTNLRNLTAGELQTARTIAECAKKTLTLPIGWSGFSEDGSSDALMRGLGAGFDRYCDKILEDALIAPLKKSEPDPLSDRLWLFFDRGEWNSDELPLRASTSVSGFPEISEPTRAEGDTMLPALRNYFPKRSGPNPYYTDQSIFLLGMLLTALVVGLGVIAVRAFLRLLP